MNLLDRVWGDPEYQRVMSPVGLYTYEWIARGLPSDIRREIEAGMDCIGDGVHRWDTDHPRFAERPGFSASQYPLRECRRCGIVRSNPAYVKRSSIPPGSASSKLIAQMFR